jgi:hypothetical protein
VGLGWIMVLCFFTFNQFTSTSNNLNRATVILYFIISLGVCILTSVPVEEVPFDGIILYRPLFGIIIKSFLFIFLIGYGTTMIYHVPYIHGYICFIAAWSIFDNGQWWCNMINTENSLKWLLRSPLYATTAGKFILFILCQMIQRISLCIQVCYDML